MTRRVDTYLQGLLHDIRELGVRQEGDWYHLQVAGETRIGQQVQIVEVEGKLEVTGYTTYNL